MNRLLPFLVFSVSIAGPIGFAVGWQARARADRLDRVLVLSWGDGWRGNHLYGAHVYLVPSDQGFSVHARVYMSRGSDDFLTCGKIATVQTEAEAAAHWGSIEWRVDGLHIGGGATGNEFIVPKDKIEEHRLRSLVKARKSS